VRDFPVLLNLEIDNVVSAIAGVVYNATLKSGDTLSSDKLGHFGNAFIAFSLFQNVTVTGASFLLPFSNHHSLKCLIQPFSLGKYGVSTINPLSSSAPMKSEGKVVFAPFY
jgi:hypothetical protein